MKVITVGQSFELYMLTLNQCGADILKMSNEQIEYYILEEFLIGSTSFFSRFTLERLKNEGIIDDVVFVKSTLLQEKVLSLENSDLCNVESIKEAREWKEVLDLSDEIKVLISNKWTKEEIEYLYTI